MYEREAQLIIEDLGIQDMRFHFLWYPGKKLPGTKLTRGDCDASTVDAVIRVATGNGYRQAIKTLAHELRHAWQARSGVDQRRGKLRVWAGTKYARAEVWKGKPYLDQPHEVDARGYADDVYRRLFEGREPKVEPAARTVTQLDDLFLKVM